MQKKILLLCLSLAGMGTLYLAFSIPRKLREQAQQQERVQALPAFQFGTLNNTFFSNDNLKSNQSALVIYFNPDCEHCQYEARAIRDSLHRFAAVNVLLVSDEPMERLQQFAQEYDLADQPNIHILYDEKRQFKALFGTSMVPSIFIYNREQQLVKHFKGETKIEAILKYLDQEIE
ncbi:MAG: peroxiredoxin family protein [Saprospiraceae bacterium]